MANSNKIDDLVAMLDQMMTSGSGHINVRNESDDIANSLAEVDTKKSSECQPNMACSVPTLHQGIDDDENEPTI
ncbi:hypothetical protein EII17_07905 [Clostridiales bacterium COT073_COT-073]|nr:hypothetical protein EII17_07905 [Clostridiales bacterium COT073_COT-073]